MTIKDGDNRPGIVYCRANMKDQKPDDPHEEYRVSPELKIVRDHEMVGVVCQGFERQGFEFWAHCDDWDNAAAQLIVACDAAKHYAVANEDLN